MVKKETIENVFNTILNNTNKTYSHKPHLDSLPGDLLTSDQDLLSDRKSEIKDRIKEEKNNIKKIKSNIKQYKDFLKEDKNKLKENNKEIKNKKKEIKDLTKLTKNTINDLDNSIKSLNKALHYENGKKLTNKQLKEKWKQPEGNTEQRLKDLDKFINELDYTSKHFKELKNYSKTFFEKPFNSETSKFSGMFEDIGKHGATLDKLSDKYRGAFNVNGKPMPLLNHNELNKVQPLGNADGERHRLTAIRDSNKDLSKLQSDNEFLNSKIDSHNEHLSKYNNELSKAQTRLTDYQNELKRTNTHIE